jgi:hypothetical protein
MDEQHPGRKDQLTHGLTVREFARRYRMGKDRALAMIHSGALRALNVASTRCGRPRYVIMPEALLEFEKATRRACPLRPGDEKSRVTRSITSPIEEVLCPQDAFEADQSPTPRPPRMRRKKQPVNVIKSIAGGEKDPSRGHIPRRVGFPQT